MNKEQLQTTHSELLNLILFKRLKEALELLHKIIITAGSPPFAREHEQLEQTYKYMLKYTIEGFKDPQRDTIYAGLQKSILTLTDKVCHYLLREKLQASVYKFRQEFIEANTLTEESALEFIKNPVKGDVRRNKINILFNYILLINQPTATQSEILATVNESTNIYWTEKCVIVTALTFSLLRFFDAQKLNTLIDFYERNESQVWQRAFVGILLCLYIHNNRLKFYPELQNRILLLDENKDIAKEIEIVAIQLIKSKETEGIARKMQEEIIPEVAKITPKFIEKLDLDNIVADDMSEDENPEWEHFFDETPDLMEKMGELSTMQLEGADVFMSAFSMLKHFPFFAQTSNWFLPFYKEHHEVKQIIESEEKLTSKEQFITNIHNVPFMCNSDKYSFIFNIPEIPSTQRIMLINLFSADLEAMTEIAHDDLIIDKSKSDKFYITQYLQDMYRFYKLHPMRVILPDIFEEELDLYNKDFFDKLVNKNDVLRNIAEYYLSRKYYGNAVQTFSKLLDRNLNDYELYQKIAYSYQQLKDYNSALTFYLKAELFDQNKAWNLKKIAYCYQRLKDAEKALKYYKEAELIEPDNLNVQLNIGRCYLDMEQFDQALKYFYKIEYMQPDNVKVMRPISWCSFVSGKFEAAQKYLDKIIEREGNRHDYVNLGHVNWCNGQAAQAAQIYAQSINTQNGSYQLFREEFNQDIPYLLKHNIKENDIPLMLDHVKYLLD